VLQSMRSAAKYVWIVLIIAFVGGFLLVDSSGLLGRAPVTTNTVVATVNGEDILYLTWENAVANLDQQESQRLGRGLTLDERRELEDRAFDELVNEILLRQEYERRGISVTDDEIRDAARVSPPPGVDENPEFQTEGQFDLSKYQRFLTSPIARQQGLLLGLESFYRSEIPKQKLYDQIASDVWVSDARLWQLFRDRNDSASVSFVAFRPDAAASGAAAVTDADMSAFYNKNRNSSSARAAPWSRSWPWSGPSRPPTRPRPAPASTRCALRSWPAPALPTWPCAPPKTRSPAPWAASWVVARAVGSSRVRSCGVRPE
jgi:peptidyl-prolyl cis-trans isomerase D